MRKFFTLQFLVNTYHSTPKQKKLNSFDLLSGREQFKAPERCVENILDFARSYRVAESKTTGKVEMILN